MSQEETYYRTTPARTAKMMAIMLGICVVGGVIFFAMWDYWISELAPVVDMMAAMEAAVPVFYTGQAIERSISFVESSDRSEMAFNSLTGTNQNPTITANVGDKILFNITNDSTVPQTFAITSSSGDIIQGTDESGSVFLWWINEKGLDEFTPGDEIPVVDTTLGAGFSGNAEFVPSEEGIYYYISAVPGYRELGLSGEIIVGTVDESAVAAGPTGVSHNFTLDFVESSDLLTLAFNALPGEDGHNPEIRVNSGDEITISSTNQGISFHSFGVVTDPNDFTSVVWESEIAAPTNPLKPSEGGETTFMAGAPGTYYYICTVPGHAALGMQGNFIVE